MTTVIANKMYIATQRGILHYTECEINATLNYAHYWNDAKVAIGSLSNLLEVTLFGGKSYTIPFTTNSAIVVLALYNAVTIFHNEKEMLLYPGQVFIVPNSLAIRIENSNEEDCSFLLFSLENKNVKKSVATIENLQIDTVKNKFQTLDVLPNVKIACLEARQEIEFAANSSNGLFLYNLNGAFEADNCLVGPCDGVSIHKTDSFEIEAFEPNTIILAIDL